MIILIIKWVILGLFNIWVVFSMIIFLITRDIYTRRVTSECTVLLFLDHLIKKIQTLQIIISLFILLWFIFKWVAFETTTVL